MRTRRHAFLAATLITVGVVAAPPPAYAGTGRGPGGQTLSVTPSTGLGSSGATVTVSGSGYDVTKGIYVAFCVDNGAGTAPGPCGGGADTTGSLGASHWISSNPPSYGEGLAVAYGSGGSFRVTLRVTPAIGAVDCTTRRCVVATRADHTRAADRSQDVRVAVTFARSAAPASTGSRPAQAGTVAPGRTPAGSTGAPGNTAAPGPSTARTAPPAPAGSPGIATTAGDGAAVAGAAPTEPAISRVSAATGTGRGWTIALLSLALAVTALLGLRRWRRRGTAR
ncbi:hypothetical protein OG777_29235 [Micromonospora peucetia]|uniref:hypothetical protein n=1 Tax=Micromonospora peucetia TaxID=47871 RepID=UPI00224D5CB9|nr:hypothetical protein [Micromonospora peucetia]MCX4390988.1 hypothetical protein [Micromonospora peucetia]